MTEQLAPHSLIFVWPADLTTSRLLSIKKKCNTDIIIDLSAATHPDLFLSGFAVGNFGIRLLWSQFNSEKTRETLVNNPPQNLWIECDSGEGKADFAIIRERLSDFDTCQTYLITADVVQISDYFEKREEKFRLALKGNEAVGFSGPETTLSLVSFTESLAEKHDFHPRLSIWGGICTPEAAAALLLSGAEHIVFEHLHLGTDQLIGSSGSQLADRLAGFRLEHTRLLAVSGSTCFRVHDKGNSAAVANLAGRLSEQLAAPELASVPLHRSSLSPDQLVGAGVETGFANSFRLRFGDSTPQAIQGFTRETALAIRKAKDRPYIPGGSALARELGCLYPFIQGAMACITDSPRFGRAVAEAGGLPTFALGIKNSRQLRSDLGDLAEVMGTFSYGVNIITLPENPCREEQLAWINEIRPPFVVISAGSPLFARDLQQQGLKVIYVTSDPHLLRLAWENGIRLVVCEGHEAGGHVGHHSTLTLAQTAMELHRTDPACGDKPIILAGGIFDGASAGRAFLLGARGVQLGTAYLATREIVQENALHRLYQEFVINSAFGDTTVTGQSVGLQVRALASPKSMRIKQRERDFLQQGKDEAFIRKQMEKLSIGSLTIAAKGSLPGSTGLLSDEQCMNQGQYMSGSVAGVLDRVISVSELHEKLASPGPRMVLRGEGDLLCSVKRVAGCGNRIAVTGMAVSNALGNSPQEVWRNSHDLMSGITEVPVSRWDHKQYFHEQPGTPGRTYCSAGAFSSLVIDRKELGISPHDFRTMAHSTRLTLWLANRAITDSGILDSPVAPERIGVIVAQNSGESADTIGDLTITVKAAEIARTVQQTLNLDQTTTDLLIEGLTRDRISTDDTTLLGRLSCTAGGFICNKYNFRGPSFAVTAACATGLVALYNAVQLIKNGILDVAIVGGGEELLHPASYLEFSALGALGGRDRSIPPTGTSRPFDSRRDGMILGEGGAMIVIEREETALNRGAGIYACITGTGASNNNLGMIESVAETQQLAIQASFQDAGYSPSEVDLVECHATATPTGDVEEIKALKGVYPPGSNTVLASFKSQIGHTLGTSGLNSLIRGICAMNSSFFPPTLNYDAADPQIDLESWGFRVCKSPEKWPHDNSRPRRFQVNAFGFGGANYVVQVEQADRDSRPDGFMAAPALSADTEPATTSALPGIDFHLARSRGDAYRVAVVDNMGSLVVEKSLRDYLALQPNGSAAQKRTLNNLGIFLEKQGKPVKLALLFAGQGTHYKQMGRELYRNFPFIRRWMKKIGGLADFDILEVMFRDEAADLRKTVWQQPALFVLEYSIYKQLETLGLCPAVLAGHSMGELTALAVAGVFGYEDAFRIISKRAACMEKAGSMVGDPGAMLAVDVPQAVLDAYVEADEGLYYTNYNSPNQRVIGGSTAAIERISGELERQKYWNHRLAVSMAFHSPIMKVIRDELGDYLADIDFSPPGIPVVSNTTGEIYPEDTDKIQEIILAHLESPVHWQSNMTTIRDEFKAGLFLEIGPRDTLCRFLQDIDPGSDSLFTCYPEKEVRTFKNTVASLYCRGHVESPSAVAELNLDDPRREKGADRDEILKIIQQEINTYALQGVEKYLKPAILSRIKRQVDPGFKAENLAEFFAGPPQGGLVQTDYFVPTGQVTAVPQAEATGDDRDAPSTVERLISIIMDATGYERSEIEPGMDIRQDLSIRSSRLPVIMDSAEKTFGITIRLEEFMGIQTIAEFADRIDRTMAEQGDGKAATDAGGAVAGSPDQDRLSHPPRAPIGRLVPNLRELPPGSMQSLELEPDCHVLILALCDDEAVIETRDCLAQRFSATTTTVRLSADGRSDSVDPLELDRIEKVLAEMPQKPPLSGIVILSDLGDSTIQAAQINRVLTSLFCCVRHLLQSEERKFCLHVSLEGEESLVQALTAEGLLGIFLAARIEYQSMIFRSLKCWDLPDMHEILAVCLDRNQPLVELELQGGTLYTREYVVDEGSCDSCQFDLFSRDKVILLTGGAKGVTARLARNINRFGPTLVLVGSTPYHNDFNYRVSDTQLLDYLDATWPGADSVTRQSRLQELQSGREIDTLLYDLRENGSTADYICCDITDVEKVRETVALVHSRHGAIDSMVHGAGIIADAFISLMGAEDFLRVNEVKLSGLKNLVDAVGLDALQHITGFSSLAAITGNIGQANYCCANRTMSRYLGYLDEHLQIRTKVFWLPPVEGAGMISDPEVKELINLKVGSQAFVDADEICEVVVRELLAPQSPHCWVAPVRRLPVLNGLSIQEIEGAGHDSWFDCRPYTMIDRITETDFRAGRIVAERFINQQHDLWINDHKPFKWLDHPICSAIMIVETFLEACALHHPGFKVVKLRDITFDRILECPPDTGVKIFIDSRTLGSQFDARQCRIAIGRLYDAGQSAAPGAGSEYFRAEADLNLRGPLVEPLQDGTAPPRSSPVMDRDEILLYYQDRTGLTGRYRVLGQILEMSETTITGTMTCPGVDDFSTAAPGRPLYPRYLLEALMQLAGFYSGITHPGDDRIKVPAGIGELTVLGDCTEGQEIYLSAELLEEDGGTSRWAGRAVNEFGEPLLRVERLEMKWLG